MSELQKYRELDKAKRQLTLSIIKNAPSYVKEYATKKVETISKELGLIQLEQSKEEMILNAYCNEKYYKKVNSTIYIPHILNFENINNLTKNLDEILNNSYKNIYNNTTKEFSKSQTEWHKYLIMGRFKDVEEVEYKKILLENWESQRYSFKKLISDINTEEKAIELQKWIKEKINELNSNKQVSVPILALYYFYLNSSNEFNIQTLYKDKNKKEAFAEFASKELKLKSRQTLYLEYSKYSKTSNRINSTQIKKLKQVITLLDKYPIAKVHAMSDLEKSKLT